MADLKIEMTLDKSAAERESAAFHAREKQRINRLLTDAEVAEKAKAEFARRANQQRIQEAAKASKTSVELARDEAKAQAQAAKEAAKAQADAAKEALREQVKAAKEAAAERKRAERDVANAQRDASRMAAQASKEAAAQREADARALKATMAGAIASGAALMGQVDQTFKRVSEAARQATLETINYRKALIELASLRGETGQTTPELRKNVALAAQTGLKLEDVNALATSAQAGAFAVLDRPGQRGLMSEKEFSELIRRTGRYAAYMGGDAGSYGMAASMIPVLEGKRMTADQAESRLLQYDRLATIGGFTNPGQMLEQLRKNQGLVTAGVLTGPESAGLLSSYALSSPGEAATRVQQAINTVSSGLLRDRGMKISDDFADSAKTSSEYFKSIGVTPGMSPIRRLELISDDLNRARAEAMKKGGHLDANEYLLQQGITTDEGRRALMEFSGNRGKWDASIVPEINNVRAPGTIDKTFNDAARRDPAIRQGIVDATSQMATIAAGAGGELRDQMRMMAFNSLKAEGKAIGSFEDYNAPLGVSDLFSWSAKDRFFGGMNQQSLDRRAAQIMLDQAKAAGIPTDFGTPAWQMAEELSGRKYGQALGGPAQTPQERAAVYNRFGNLLTSAGVGPMPGAEGIERAADKMLKASENMTTAAKSNVPPPLQGAPRQPPAAAR